jgi:mannose-6-phosphate isomerase-like protein (cupin superfamily)
MHVDNTRLKSVAIAPHYIWGDGCDGWHLVQTPDLSIIEEYMPPDRGEVRHRHMRARQFFYVLQGDLTIESEGTVWQVGEHAGLEIPPGQAHEVRSGRDAARFLVISQPASHGDREPAPRADD